SNLDPPSGSRAIRNAPQNRENCWKMRVGGCGSGVALGSLGPARMDRCNTPPLPLIPKLRISGGRSIAVQEQIGQGSVASVYAGTVSGTATGHRRVAVKIFDRLPGDEKERILTTLARTMGAATCVCDPRVVQLIDYDLSRSLPF